MEVSITEKISGNLLIREVRLPNRGDAIPGHVHKYDHTMFFMSGKAELRITKEDGSVEVSEVIAPTDMLVAKNTLHAIEALTESVYFCCVFPHRDFAGNVTEMSVSRDAY